MKPLKASLFIFSLLISTAATAQYQMDISGDGKGDSGFQVKWDSSQEKLIVFRDISSADIPSAKIFDSNGQSTPIFILRDFRSARFADIWASASTPDGGAVFSVVLGFGERPTPKTVSSGPVPEAKVLLLTYGSDGALKKVWNVAPYLHQSLAVDRSGNIYALGTRDSGPEGFPTVIKYSKSGDVLGEYVPSKTFANGAKALDPSALNGSPALYVRNQQLVLWVPSVREIFKLSLNGELQRKIAVGPQIDRLAAQSGFVKGTIAGLAVNGSGGLAIQVRLWPSTASSEGMMLGMIDVSADGAEMKLATPLTGLATLRQQFLGVSEDGKHVVLEHDGKGRAFIRKQ
jgi:hypothetical protein